MILPNRGLILQLIFAHFKAITLRNNSKTKNLYSKITCGERVEKSFNFLFSAVIFFSHVCLKLK